MITVLSAAAHAALRSFAGGTCDGFLCYLGERAGRRKARPQPMNRNDQRTRKFAARKIFRGTQVIFGERKHLQEVLGSLRSAPIPKRRKRSEMGALRQLIAARTQELERIAPHWDRKFRRARNPRTPARELLRLAEKISPDDYLLARALTEHADAPPELLQRLANHPYSAVRENVARHPRTPAEVLRRMAADSREPLWFLVACNPSTPDDLRGQLKERMHRTAKKREEASSSAI